MDKFTKLILNGVEKFIAAIYDGNGNQIDTTYETIQNVATKEGALSQRIDTTNQTLSALTERVVVTEAFKSSIDTNASSIAAQSLEIQALKGVDAGLQEDIDDLTIAVGENADKITSALTNASAASSAVLLINNEVATLKGIVNDGATGVNALNDNKADKTTVEALSNKVTALESGKVNQSVYDTKVGELTTAIGNKALQSDLESLIARVAALEAALEVAPPTDPEGGEEEPTE